MASSNEQTVAREWESFWQAIAPVGAPPDQYREMRRAFYAGAWGMIKMCIKSTEMPEDESINMMNRLHTECLDFATGVKYGKF